MKRILSVVAACAMVATALPSAAQAAPSQRSLDLARRYVAALDMDKNMDAMMKSMLPAMVAAQTKQHPGLSPDKHQAILEASAESTKVMLPKMMDRFVPVMAEILTEQELSDLVTFYESTTGRSIIAKTPQFGAAMGKVMAEIMPEFQADLRQRICTQIDCRAAEAGNSPKGS
ncbi:MAG: DUF2059 domain-containing protein [Caulobacter sp.]